MLLLGCVQDLRLFLKSFLNFCRLAHLRLNKEVKIGVVHQRAHGVAFAKEPWVVPLAQALSGVVHLEAVLEHLLFQLIGQIILSLEQRKVHLAERQAKGHDFKIVLKLQQLPRGQPNARVHLETLHDQSREDLVVKLKRVLLVDPEIENILLRFLNGLALEWVLLRY